jgi:hypothetical protein
MNIKLNLSLEQVNITMTSLSQFISAASGTAQAIEQQAKAQLGPQVPADEPPLPTLVDDED